MTTAVTPIITPVTQEDFALGVILSNDFRLSRVDGWIYPKGQDPLVRVRVQNGRYTMERRRTPQSVWMEIVTASVREFDQAGFESWVANWPLTA